jgi:hypothetical protein
MLLGPLLKGAQGQRWDHTIPIEGLLASQAKCITCTTLVWRARCHTECGSLGDLYVYSCGGSRTC